MDDDAEIIAEFLVESHENLDQLDSDLVELEQNPGSRELLSSIFRTIHTIKGTSGFLALGRLEGLTHVGETLLSNLRDGEFVMNEAVAEALLRMVDTVRGLLEVIERTGSDADPSVDVAPVQARIEVLLANGGQDPAMSGTPVVDLRVDWHDDPIGELSRLWALWRPLREDYITRGLDPATAPAYGVPGDR